jgi:hypothetical protein
MYRLNILLACFFICISLKIEAQDATPFTPDASYSDGKKYREVIVNSTSFIAQFVPFNANTLSRFNIYDYEYRALRNGRGWRWSLAASVSESPNIQELNNINLRIGLIKRRQISQRFHFTRSWDLNLIAESVDNNGQPIGKIGFSGLGFSYAPGIEYSITSRLSLSTEGILFLGIAPIDGSGSGTIVKFIPPVGLFFHVKF